MPERFADLLPPAPTDVVTALRVLESSERLYPALRDEAGIYMPPTRGVAITDEGWRPVNPVPRFGWATVPGVPRPPMRPDPDARFQPLADWLNVWTATGYWHGLTPLSALLRDVPPAPLGELFKTPAGLPLTPGVSRWSPEPGAAAAESALAEWSYRAVVAHRAPARLATRWRHAADQIAPFAVAEVADQHAAVHRAIGQIEPPPTSPTVGHW